MLFNDVNKILKMLSNKDKKEIKSAFEARDFTIYPKMGADSKILPSQWKSWQVIQRKGLGLIKGNEECGELKLTEFGKELAKEI